MHHATRPPVCLANKHQPARENEVGQDTEAQDEEQEPPDVAVVLTRGDLEEAHDELFVGVVYVGGVMDGR